MEFCHSVIKDVYHNLFDEVLERYNIKQKRSDRKIDDYYEKIRRGKQEKLFYEVIFKIGNKNGNEGHMAKLERMKELCEERNNLYEKQNDLKGQKYKIDKSLER